MKSGLTRKQESYIYSAIMFPYKTDAELAEIVGVTAGRVATWKSDPEFKEAYDFAIRESWKDAVKIAKSKIVDLVENGADAVALNAAKFIMSTNGFSENKQLEVKATVNTIKVDIDDES